MRILVTGGAGYLGSVLAMGLVEQGQDVRVLDNLRYGGRSLLGIFGHPHFDLVVGDLRDPRVVDRALRRRRRHRPSRGHCRRPSLRDRAGRCSRDQ